MKLHNLTEVNLKLFLPFCHTGKVKWRILFAAAVITVGVVSMLVVVLLGWITALAFPLLQVQ